MKPENTLNVLEITAKFWFYLKIMGKINKWFILLLRLRKNELCAEAYQRTTFYQKNKTCILLRWWRTAGTPTQLAQRARRCCCHLLRGSPAGQFFLNDSKKICSGYWWPIRRGHKCSTNRKSFQDGPTPQRIFDHTYNTVYFWNRKIL